MAKFEATKCHGHPAFDVCRQKDESPVFDDPFQIRIEELQHEIEVCFRGEDVQKLQGSLSVEHLKSWRGRAYFNYILVLQLPQIFDFTYCGHIQSIFELPNLDFLNSDLSASGGLPSCDGM